MSKKKQSGLNFVPNKLKYLVKREEALTQTEAGLYIPEQAKERPMEGVILSVGPEGQYKEKDHVLFGKYDGVEVVVDGIEYLILEESHILGKRV